MHNSDPRHVSDQHSGQSKEPSRVVSAIPQTHADKRKHKVRSRYLSQSSSLEEDQSSTRSRPTFYREVAMADLPSQYAEEVETFRRILDLPDPSETMPRSFTSVWAWTTKKANKSLGQEALPLCSLLALRSNNTFDKFEHDFLAPNLPEGKYIKPPPSTAKCYKVGLPCYENKIQELNTGFLEICISPKPSVAPMGKVPLPVLKELEH